MVFTGRTSLNYEVARHYMVLGEGRRCPLFPMTETQPQHDFTWNFHGQRIFPLPKRYRFRRASRTDTPTSSLSDSATSNIMDYTLLPDSRIFFLFVSSSLSSSVAWRFGSHDGHLGFSQLFFCSERARVSCFERDFLSGGQICLVIAISDLRFSSSVESRTVNGRGFKVVIGKG